MSAESAGDLRLEHATVIDVEAGTLHGEMTVTVREGIIVDVSPAATASASDRPGARTIDATGGYLVPGFNDMHVHVLQSPDPAPGLALMLANGITGIRQMAGSDELLERRRRGALDLGLDAPELLALPGQLLTPFNAGTPEAAARTISEQKDAGADFIKMILVPPPAVLAALRSASDSGMLVAGHLQNGVHPAEQSAAGFRCIEHLGTGSSVWIACSTDETDLWGELATLAPRPIPLGGGVDPRVAARFPINPLARTAPGDAALLERARRTFSEEKAVQLAARLRGDGTWQVPTLVRLRAMDLPALAEHTQDPHLRYVPARTLADWREVTALFETQPETTRATLGRGYQREVELTGIYEREGTLMMTGSDQGGGWVVPGFSLHREFDELAAAGIAPLKILQMTTSLPAQFLGRQATMGSVAPGRKANLVLLDGDPTASVDNLHRVRAVLREGRFYQRADLDALLAGAEPQHHNEGATERGGHLD